MNYYRFLNSSLRILFRGITRVLRFTYVSEPTFTFWTSTMKTQEQYLLWVINKELITYKILVFIMLTWTCKSRLGWCMEEFSKNLDNSITRPSWWTSTCAFLLFFACRHINQPGSWKDLRIISQIQTNIILLYPLKTT